MPQTKRSPRGRKTPIIHVRACYLLTLRVLLGVVMLWAFLDKLLGLGFSTQAQNAWIAGGSPTSGFLANAPYGPLAGLFNSLAPYAIIEWLFMIGLLAVGVSFVFGIATRLGAWAGAAMMALMYLSMLPPETNPLISYHVVYAVLFLALGHATYTHRFDVVRNWWLDRPFVKGNSLLE